MPDSPASTTTPTALAAVAQEMKEAAQWVAYRTEPRDNGKINKIPVNPHTGKYADVSDQATWSTLDQALDAVKRDSLAGVGFVFTEEAGIVGIDLDYDATTGKLDPFAERIIKRFPSYTEVSPSGRGVHILCSGTLPTGGSHRRGNVEIYGAGRYFTVTGNLLPSANSDLVPCQAAINALQAWIDADAELVEAAKGDPRFGALWGGDISAYNDDHSAADQALCNMLAPRCNCDPTQVDRIFRWSGLMRDKWDQKHSADGNTYGEMTIAKSLEVPKKPVVKETASARGPVRIRSLEEIMNSDEQPPAKILEGLVEEGGISLLIARQKAGKSMLGLQLAIDVANGTTFLSCVPTSPGPVLYVDYENRSHILKDRGNDFGRGFDVGRVWIANYDKIADRDLGLDGTQLEQLKAQVSEYRPRLLIIDPLRLATAQDLKDDRAMVKALEGVSQLFEINPAMGILLIHHLKKTQNIGKAMQPKLLESPQDWIDSIYGSQALLAHVETIIGLDQLGEAEYALATVARGSGSIRFRLTKLPGSERFILDAREKRLSKVSAAIKLALDQLQAKFPDGFSWSEGGVLVGNSGVDRAIRKGRELGLIRQDAATKRYHWVKDNITEEEPKAA